MMISQTNRYSRFKRALSLCLCIILTLAFFTSAYAEQITAIDLGIDDLTLKSGESYTFDVTYEPAVPQFYTLSWFVTDDSVVEVDVVDFTVKALNPGEADILAESFDGVSFDVCHVTVTGSPQDEASKNDSKAGSGSDSSASFVELSQKDSEKISSPSINRFLDFLENSNVSGMLLAKAQERSFIVTASVKPGTEEAESKRAYDLGMADATPLKKLNAVTLQGSLKQILLFTENNEDLIEIFEMNTVYLNDTMSEACVDCKPETTGLEGHVEDLTSVSIAHKAGFTGACSTVAIIDTGINSDHEQFKGRVTHEACFGRPTGTIDDAGNFLHNVCVSEDSALPGNAYLPHLFSHGSHVAGIAAGRNGIAPKANIIAVQAFTEQVFRCASKDLKNHAYSQEESLCASNTLYGADRLMAYNYLLELVDSGVEITALNMSYSDKFEHPCPCDNDPGAKTLYCMYHYLEEANVIPVAAAGNESYNCGIGEPACFSNVMAVGALADASAPLLASFSNHNEMIDITAPGTGIKSALYEGIDKNGKIVCKAGENCYGYMDGTSMAAPMVTGALALLRQAYPDMSVAGLKGILTGMSTKFVTKRENGIPVVAKPVLDFTSFRYLRPMRCFVCPAGMYVLPHTGFSTMSENVMRPQPMNVSYSKTGLRVMIPSLSVESDILSVPFVENDYPVEWLQSSVGMLEGSGEPGDGVIVLTGHNHIDNTQAGPFVALGSLDKGDKIMLLNEKGKLFSYTVFANELIGNDDIEAFEAQVNRVPNSVTLLTCEVEQLEGGYAYRRVISAKFDSKAK